MWLNVAQCVVLAHCTVAELLLLLLLWGLVRVWLQTMNASCGMDFCLIARLLNNNHTNEVLFRGEFQSRHVARPHRV